MKAMLQYFIFMMIITASTSAFASHFDKTQKKQSILTVIDQRAVQYINKIHTNTAANNLVRVRNELQPSLNELTSQLLADIDQQVMGSLSPQSKTFTKKTKNYSKKDINLWCASRGYEINMDNTRLSSCDKKCRYPIYFIHGGITIISNKVNALNNMINEWNSIPSYDQLSKDRYAQKLIDYGVITKINTPTQESNQFLLNKSIFNDLHINYLPIAVPNAMGKYSMLCFTKHRAQKQIKNQLDYAQKPDITLCKNTEHSCESCKLKAVRQYRDKLIGCGLLKMDLNNR